MSHFARLIPHCFRNLALQLGSNYGVNFFSLQAGFHVLESCSVCISGIFMPLGEEIPDGFDRGKKGQSCCCRDD